MLLKKTTIILIASLIGIMQIYAAPVEHLEGSLEVVATEIHAGETLTWYRIKDNNTNTTASLPSSSSPSSSPPPPLPHLSKRACGSNEVICDPQHNLARDDFCQHLIDIVAGSPSTAVPSNSLSVCNQGCCISWRDSGPQLIWGNLVDAARAIYRGCHTGFVSGYAQNVDLQGVCTHECLSSRNYYC